MSDPVRLYLVRHAIAADRGSEWPDDTQRPLTKRGVARMRRSVEGLRALGVQVDLILTSPLVRAMQTARILAAGLRPKPALERLDALGPGIAPSDVAAALTRHDTKDAGTIALVGHEPGLGLLAAWLLGTDTPLPFKKGGVCRIDVVGLPPGRDGALVWFATPKMLRTLDGR
jgi:phosphohistidine phosphatase